MLVYRSSKGKGEEPKVEAEKEDKKITLPAGTTIPAGRPYLTTIKGKVVMARHKKEKSADYAVDLLTGALGVKLRERQQKQKTAKTLTGTAEVVVINGVAYVQAVIPQIDIATSGPLLLQALMPGSIQYQQQQQALPTSHTPFQQQAHQSFQQLPQYSVNPSEPNSIPPQQWQYPPHEPPRYSFGPSEPSAQDLAELKKVDTHFKAEEEKARKAAAPSAEPPATKTGMIMVKHVCANCNRIRSSKYHHEHPIKAGEEPVPGFCRKCQKETSSTDESDGGRYERRRRPYLYKQHEKKTEQEFRVRASSPRFVRTSSRSPFFGDQLIIVDEETSDHQRRPLPKRYKKKFTNKEERRKQDSRERLGFLFRYVPAEDYDVVDNKFVEKGLYNRGRTRFRASERLEYSPSLARNHSFERISAQQERRPSPDRRIQPCYYETILEPEAHPGYTPRFIDDGFESVGSQRSQDSARRRRRERSQPDDYPPEAWERASVSYSRDGDAAVNTRRTTHRPRRQRVSVEHRSRDESAQDGDHRSRKSSLADEVYESRPNSRSIGRNYLYDNLGRPEEGWRIVESRKRRPEYFQRLDRDSSNGRYEVKQRRGRSHRDHRLWELSDSDESVGYRRAYDMAHQNLSRDLRSPSPVPSYESFTPEPPRPLRSQYVSSYLSIEDSPEASPSKRSAASERVMDHNGGDPDYHSTMPPMPSDSDPAVPRNHSRRQDADTGEIRSASNITEREILVTSHPELPSGARHVRFRGPNSLTDERREREPVLDVENVDAREGSSLSSSAARVGCTSFRTDYSLPRARSKERLRPVEEHDAGHHDSWV